MNKKFTSTVAGASILLTTVGLMSRGLGLIREMVFASSFGLSKSYDLFLVGTVLPLTLNTIIIYIAQNYFIPVYNKLNSQSSELSKTFIIKSFTMFIAGGFIIMSLFFLFSESLIDFYIRNAAAEEVFIAIKVLKIYSITIPFNAGFSILSAYLYSEFDFKLPTISQLFINIAVIISVIIFSGELGVISIAYGYLIGIFIQFLFVLIYTLRVKLNFLKLKGQRTKLFYWDSGLMLIIIIEALSQIYLISDRYFLTQVDKGGIAALNYSMNIFLLPISIISVSLSTALFPSFSKSFVENNVNEINAKLAKFFSVNLFLFVPLTFIMFFFGDVIIKILFQRGAFSSNDSLMTFETLKYFAISLIFYSCYAVLNKLMYSLELIKQLLIVTILGCSIKVILNFLLVPLLKQDGLALSSSISYIFFFLTTLMLIKGKIKLNTRNSLMYKLFFIIISSFFALFISWIIITDLFRIIDHNFISRLFHLVLFIIIYTLNLIFFDRDSLVLYIKTLQLNFR